MVELIEVTVIKAPIVEVHLAGNVHWGESAVAAAGVTSGLIGPGENVTWRAKHFGVWHTLTSEITAMSRPIHFQDAMTRGPFRLMRHDHFFRASRAGETEMRDVFVFAAPLPVLGRLAEITFLRRYMQSLLRERNAVLKEIAEHADCDTRR